MKSRASLVLMEQLVMILVFALAASLCLQAFLYADQVSQETELQDQAVVLAQNGAELLKSSGGSLEQVNAALDGDWDGEILTVCRGQLRMEIEISRQEIPGLGQGEVRVLDSTGQLLFSLVTAWQEVAQ